MLLFRHWTTAGKKKINPPHIFIYGFCQRRNSNFILLPRSPSRVVRSVFFLFHFFQSNRSNAQPSVHTPPHLHYPRSTTSDGRDWKLPSTSAVYLQSGTKSILHFLPRRRFENHGIKVNRLQQSSVLSRTADGILFFYFFPFFLNHHELKFLRDRFFDIRLPLILFIILLCSYYITYDHGNNRWKLMIMI